MFQRGEKNPNTRLTEIQVRDIRAEYAAGGTSYSALAAKFGVSKDAVSNIVRRKTWDCVVASKYKVINVASIRLKPRADCIEEGCGWRHSPSNRARNAAKLHTDETGHTTLIQQINRNLYQRVPK